MSKKNIIFIQPLFYQPNLPNFKDRFEMLSIYYKGHVFSITDDNRKFNDIKFNEFSYHAIKYISNKTYRYLYYSIFIIVSAIKIKLKEKIDFIHSYDPIFFGFVAVVLKWFTGSRLIVEINGHLLKDGFLERNNFKTDIKRKIFKILIKFSIANADIIKLLNNKQIDELGEMIIGKNIVMYHDFVPTHVFEPYKYADDRFILFIGSPFYRKGIDILIKSFLKISCQYPDVKLKIVGHCSGGDSEKNIFVEMAKGNSNVQILDPVPYDEAIQLIQNCTFFVLPSRSEALGRVLIEAMAAGKAIIGSRVGGIPAVIEDGKNGYLFESENVDDLALKMANLLCDLELRERMGSCGLEMVQDKFSSQKYVECFREMLEERVDG